MSEKRHALFNFNRERIEHAYVKGVENGQNQPVVIALDLEDRMASDIASAMQSREKVSSYVKDCQSRSLVPVLFVTLEPGETIELLEHTFKTCRKSVNSVTESGNVAVAIIGDGGISWAWIPRPN